MQKLYIVIREDLELGLMLAQVVHAAFAFGFSHEETTRAWHEGENNVAVLGARDEAHLKEIFAMVEAAGVPSARFYEPDIGNALTACSFAGTPVTKRLLRKLPSALAPPRAA